MREYRLGEVAKVSWGDTSTTKASYSEAGYQAYSASGPDGFMDHFDHEGPGVVLSAIGAQCGKTWFANGKWSCIKNTIYLQANPELVDPRYLYFLTADREIWPVRGSAQPFISQTDARSIVVRIPSLPEQRRIASILSAYDDLIENNTRRIAILEEMARRIYEEWFIHFRFPGHERVRMVESELGLLPKDWECRRLNELYQTSSGGTPSRKQPEYFTGDIPWVKTRELDDGCIFSSEERITEEAVKNSSAKIFPPGTVLIAMYGATIGKLGTLAVPAATNQACCAVIPKIEGFGTEYAFLTLLFARGRLIDLRAGAAQQNINQDTVRTLLVVRPAKETLFAFNTLVAPLFACSANLRLQNTNLRTTRDLLLPKLISGELDVLTLPEPEAVAA